MIRGTQQVTRTSQTGAASLPSSIAVIPLLFVAATVYNGPGQNLHWFSAFGLLFALSLGAILIRQTKTVPIKIASGWLPTAALVLLAWLLLTPYLSTFPHTTWLHAIALSVMPLALVGWLLSPHEDRDAAWNYVWRGLVLSALALAVLGIADLLLLHQRAHGPFIDPNAYGALMNLFLLPLCYQYLRAPTLVRTSNLLLVAIAVFALAQFATFSRGALLALAATLPWAVFLTRQRNARWGKKLALLLLVLSVAYIAMRILSVEVVGIENRRIETVVLAPAEQIQTDSSLGERVDLWRSTWKMFLDGNRLIGSGLGTFKTLYPAYRSVGNRTAGNHSHNDFLQALQEGGLIYCVLLVIMAVIAPLWLLRATRRTENESSDTVSDASGLMLGVLSLSLHALVNFIYSILPLVLLTGIYLARAWEVVRERRTSLLLDRILHGVRPAILTGVVLIALTPPVLFLTLDGIIFKTFVADGAIMNGAPPDRSIALANRLIVLRPDNPIPREVLIVNLIKLAERPEAESIRAVILDQALEEAEALTRGAPDMPSSFFYRGKILAARGKQEDLAHAVDLLQQAVLRLPQSSLIRLELVRATLRLGEPHRAYELIQEAKPWIPIERNLPALAALAKEGRTLAPTYGDRHAGAYWQRVLTAIDRTPN
ncbi:MAG TPA: O-antigen ligase family protein [Candidatus Binatia bacterium]|nr:O-antigen ligase family protein [Candidatus Binatia bacterium]